MADLGWQEATLEGYGKKKKKLKYLSNTSLWGADGFFPAPIRWVLVVDSEGELDPLPLMSTDISLSPEKIIELFIQRWNMEVTFFEVREHLGVETQRQWSDKAIARTTPILMGLYTIVCLLANRLREERPIEVEKMAWYKKHDAAFSDLLKTVRKALWSDNLIFRKHMIEPFLKNNKEGNGENIEMDWISMLIEHLAAA